MKERVQTLVLEEGLDFRSKLQISLSLLVMCIYINNKKHFNINDETFKFDSIVVYCY